MRAALFALALAAALVVACKPVNVGKDGYEFGQPEYSRDIVELRVVPHDDVSDLRASAKSAGAVVEEDHDLMAYSVLSARGTVCTVHVINPTVDYQPEWIGHEIAHCVWGRWHH